METNRYQPYLQSDFSAAFNRLASLREEMDRLFESPVGPILRPPGSLRSWSPPLDVYEDKDSFTVLLDLPGLKRQDIEITLREQNLVISGSVERKKIKVKRDFAPSASTAVFSGR